MNLQLTIMTPPIYKTFGHTRQHNRQKIAYININFKEKIIYQTINTNSLKTK